MLIEDRMKTLVIGAGMMGSAAAFDLANSPGVELVIVADKDAERAGNVAAAIGPKAESATLDAGVRSDVLALMRRVDGVIGATSYTHNVALTKAAIEARVHFCDLGGNMDVVYAQMELDSAARAAGVLVSPNCGLAPGMACVIAAGAAKKFSAVDEIHLRVGGLPQHPRPPLNYQLVFSPEGLINEYIEPAEAIRGGLGVRIASMDDLESLSFPAPFGRLEAFNTSGGTSTLTRMFSGKVKDLDYKTIRYPGHCEKFKMLLDLGFAGSEPVIAGNTTRTVREFFEDLLRKRLAANGPDVVLTRVTVSGTLDGKRRILAYEMVDYYDTAQKMTSMMRTTSFPTSVILQMAIDGRVGERGVKPPEQCVPLEPFVAELAKRNITFTTTVTDL
jgi:lysine 6-dehydrogenase